MNNSPLYKQIKAHEGFRAKPYLCTAGKLTVGYGRNLEDKGLTDSEIRLIMNYSAPLFFTIACVKKTGITVEQAEVLLDNDIKECIKQLETKLRFFNKLSEPRQGVLINMAFNLGIPGLLKFKNTLHLIEIGFYKTAANEMVKSKWRKQVGHRAEQLADQMSRDEWICE